jgi:dipeptidyl aminopeptidase/acylaminoacyl peptidase
MPIQPKSKPLLALLLAAAALLAIPAAAQATLAFVRNPMHPAVFVAKDDGSAVKKLGQGSAPHVSPDGAAVAYLREGPGHAQELRLVPSAGGFTAKTLLKNWREPMQLAFSPDSATIAALRGPEIGKQKLVLINADSGAQRVVASGYFSGFSFSPDGSQIAFSKSNSERFMGNSDVYVAPASGGKAVAITRDHRSQNPLWGPSGRIVFVKLLDADKRKYGPKNELYLMNANGKQVKRLTHTKVGPLLAGLVPTDWSADGKRLLAEFVGQDTSYAVTVNPATGAQRPVAETGEAGFVATALSADGRAVLGVTGGFEPGPGHFVASVPYNGGKRTVLAKHAFDPDWSR